MYVYCLLYLIVSFPEFYIRLLVKKYDELLLIALVLFVLMKSLVVVMFVDVEAIAMDR